MKKLKKAFLSAILLCSLSIIVNAVFLKKGADISPTEQKYHSAHNVLEQSGPRSEDVVILKSGQTILVNHYLITNKGSRTFRKGSFYSC